MLLTAHIWVALTPALAATAAQASLTCSFPPDQRAGAVVGAFDAPFTCLPGNVAADWGNVSVTAPGPLAPPLHLDSKATIYDLSPVASFVGSATGRVKAAIIPRSSNVTHLAIALKSAKDDGTDIALLTEEDFEGGADQPGESITGPHVTAIAAAAKALKMYVVCPFRISVSPGESYNGAVIISRNGTILPAAHSGATHYEKVFPVLGWPIPSLSDKSAGGQKAGFSVQGGEVPVIPGQKGVQVWDLEGIGRVAILICFDINYYELWHQAYALGAQVVFWPSMMSTPDRDAISLARLFRFHIVSNGSPGNIHDTTGRAVADLKKLPAPGEPSVITGTMDLDATWVHSNGPGKMICSGLEAMCSAHPGVFELAIGGCGGSLVAKGCNTSLPTPAGESGTNNAKFLVRSLKPELMTVREGFAKYNVVPARDYLFQNRQGLNSLRHTKSAIPKGGGPHQLAANGGGAAPTASSAGAATALQAAAQAEPQWQQREAELVAAIDTLQAELAALRQQRRV